MVNEKGIKAYSNTTFYVRLRFDSERLNIGEIVTGAVKSTIDCLYPIIGGENGRPEDWRITILQIEKSKAASDGRGAHITARKTPDSKNLIRTYSLKDAQQWEFKRGFRSTRARQNSFFTIK